MNDWERKMEIHRRTLIREMILIAANTGIRCPKEMLSLKWEDISVRKETISGLFNGADKDSEELIAVIQINEEQKTGSRVVVGKAGEYFVRLKTIFVKNWIMNQNQTIMFIWSSLVEESLNV